MHFLVCVPKTLVLYRPKGSSSDPDSDLDLRLREIKEEKEAAQTALRGVMDRLSAMSSDLSSRNKRFIDDIDDIQRKIKEVNDEIRAEILLESQTAPDDLDQEFADFDTSDFSFGADFSNEFVDHEMDATESTFSESLEVKRLYRLIANKTHPDKTDDPELHSLFIAAKACRNIGDLQGLIDIWDLVSGRSSALLNKMLATIAELRADLQNIKRQLEHLFSSVDYELLKLYEQDKHSFYNISRMQLERKYHQLYRHYQMLLTLVEKPVIKSSFFRIEM